MLISENNKQALKEQMIAILMASTVQISTILPSEWTEKNYVVKTGNFKGPFQYAFTPYTEKIINHVAPYDPKRIIIVKKAGQIGVSAGVILPGIGYTIANCPGNTVFTVGAPDLIEKASGKLDMVIESCKLTPLIRPQVIKARNQKTGDKIKAKEFIGGGLMICTPNNHKMVRQEDFQYGWMDDWEAAKSKSKESGSSRKLWEKRFASYSDTKKIFYISTPESLNGNIQEVFELGDQQKYMMPCPCCGEMISLEWSIEDESGNQTAGIIWELTEKKKLKPGSVRYRCQKCYGEFTEAQKYEMVKPHLCYWEPTAEPWQDFIVSYDISALYAPPGMDGWEHHVNDWLEANPPGQPRKESLHQAFVNLVLAKGYDLPGVALSANKIQKNIRPYEVGTAPEAMSIADGNGRIVLITLAADMNGKMEGVNGADEDDVRLDWAIKAHTESGSSYSLAHGSIGTFYSANTSKGKDAKEQDRVKWTYAHNAPNSVWPELERILRTKFKTDTDGRELGILTAALDCGYNSKNAYTFIDGSGHSMLRGVKGDAVKHFLRFQDNSKRIKPGVERDKLYILTVGMYKEDISDNMNLNWHKGEAQPPGFMNFPTPSGGLYTFEGFFEHYQAEIRREEVVGDRLFYIWEKKNSAAQNHFFDCEVYNNAAKDIFLLELGKAMKKPVTWQDYIAMLPPLKQTA